MFGLRFDDDRYLPFEGTGAVSTLAAGAAGRRPSTTRPARRRRRHRPLHRRRRATQAFATAVKGMLKPYPAARYVDVAAEFPDDWAQFLDGDDSELVLPFSADMFPGMASRADHGDLPDLRPRERRRGAARPRRRPTAPAGPVGRLLPTPGLRVARTAGPAGPSRSRARRTHWPTSGWCSCRRRGWRSDDDEDTQGNRHQEEAVDPHDDVGEAGGVAATSSTSSLSTSSTATRTVPRYGRRRRERPAPGRRRRPARPRRASRRPC